ncbi:hypothetical protein Ancab_003353 [Ancistrocladus abbreviatus]
MINREKQRSRDREAECSSSFFCPSSWFKDGERGRDLRARRTDNDRHQCVKEMEARGRSQRGEREGRVQEEGDESAKQTQWRGKMERMGSRANARSTGRKSLGRKVVEVQLALEEERNCWGLRWCFQGDQEEKGMGGEPRLSRSLGRAELARAVEAGEESRVGALGNDSVVALMVAAAAAVGLLRNS